MTLDQRKRFIPVAAYYAAIVVMGLGEGWPQHWARYPLWLALIVATTILGLVPWLIYRVTPVWVGRR